MRHGPGGHIFGHSGGGRRGGFLQPCLLLILTEGSQHGYSLMEELSRRKLVSGDVDVGNLYRALRQMEAQGWVTSSWSEPGSGPNKRVYQITAAGQGVLQGWAGMLEQRTRLINRFLGEFHRIFGRPAEVQPGWPGSEDDEDNPI